MKKNLLKRIGAVALALAVSLTMGTSAFAVDTEDEGVSSDSAITEVVVPKEVVLFNTATEQVYEPNVTYTYGIATQDPSSATITDKDENKGTVKTGVAGLVKIQGSNKDGYTGTAGTSDVTLVFGDDNSTKKDTVKEGTTITADNAKVAVRNLKLTFDVSAVSAAGIYRYKITDKTEAATLKAAGVARNDNYDPVRYLDVYVKWADADHTSLQVYGYVLYKTTDSTNTADGTSSFKYDKDATTAVKVTGYNVVSEMRSTTGKTNSTSDQYHTYNLKVTKTTTGTLADKTNEFPVAVSFTNADVTALADFYSTGDFADANLALNESGSYTVNTNFSATPSVKNGDTFTFIGLPAGTKFLVNEKNNTNDSYKVKITDATTSADLFPEAAVASQANTALTTATNLNNAKGEAYETEDVQITNTLNSISPTNVAMRFAPYLFILGAAILLIFMMRRRRAAQDAE